MIFLLLQLGATSIPNLKFLALANLIVIARGQKAEKAGKVMRSFFLRLVQIAGNYSQIIDHSLQITTKGKTNKFSDLRNV